MTVDDKNIKVLLVEDNPADVFLFRTALAEVSASSRLEVVRDGLEARRRLEQAAFDPAAKPDLLVLDLNLPSMSGRELLGELRAHPNLRDLPVAILTGSVTDYDIVDEFSDLRLLFKNKVPTFPELKAVVAEFFNFANVY